MSEPAIRLTPRATVGAQVRSLQQQIKDLSACQREDFIAAIERACRRGGEITENPAQPPGVRDLARRFVEDEEAKAVNIRAIGGRGS